jgi:hypothetical protein
MSDEDTTSQEGELTPAQKKAYLECRPSDARTVETIANAGHGLSLAIAVGGAAAGSCLAVE